jgi:hypothetical protein
MKILKDSFTVANGQDFDIGKILWVMVSLTFMVLAIFSILLKGQAFDPVGFGTGAGLVLAGGGAALGLKSGTEPK